MLILSMLRNVIGEASFFILVSSVEWYAGLTSLSRAFLFQNLELGKTLTL